MSESAEGTVHPAKQSRPYSILAVAAVVAALLLALAAALSGLGSRWGWWGFGTGFTILRWSAYGAVGAIVLALGGLFRTRPGSPRRGLGLALAALVVSALVFGVPWSFLRTAQDVPPIHDISTDLENPPEFVAVLPLRAGAPNPAEHGGEEIAEQQREGYPDLGPIHLGVPPSTAYERALEAARRMGWEIVAEDAGQGRIEATATTFWYGFEDDVVIRVRPEDGGSRIDVRSVSRVGRSDVGKNAARIRNYQGILEDLE